MPTPTSTAGLHITPGASLLCLPAGMLLLALAGPREGGGSSAPSRASPGPPDLVCPGNSRAVAGRA